MDIIKDEAIVLRKLLVGDYDVSITIYSKKYGKENIYIPKGQHLKSPYIYVSEPMCWFKGLFIKRKEKVFIKEIERSIPLGIKIGRDLNKFKLSIEIIDLFNKYVIFPDERLYILLKKTLYYLTIFENIDIIKLNFIAKLVYLSGIYPELDNCIKCSKPVNKSNFQMLLLEEGGVVCNKCSRKKSTLSYSHIISLKRLKFSNFRSLAKIKIANKKRLEKILLEYLVKNL